MSLFNVLHSIFKRKADVPNDELLQRMFEDYERDLSKESEFRCIAGICSRPELLSAICEDSGLVHFRIAAIALILLFNYPADIPTDYRTDFAKFRDFVRKNFLETWLELNVMEGDGETI